MSFVDDFVYKYSFSQYLTLNPIDHNTLEVQEKVQCLSNLLQNDGSNLELQSIFLNSKPDLWLLPSISLIYSQKLYKNLIVPTNSLVISLLKLQEKCSNTGQKPFGDLQDLLFSWNGAIINIIHLLQANFSETTPLHPNLIPKMQLFESCLTFLDHVFTYFSNLSQDLYHKILPSLIIFLSSPSICPIEILTKACQCILTIIPSCYCAFKELSGPLVLLKLLIFTLSLAQSQSLLVLINNVLSLLSLTLPKSDFLHSNSQSNLREIVEYDLYAYLKTEFLRKNIPVYEPIMSLLAVVFTEFPGCMNDAIAQGVIGDFIESLEAEMPLNPSFVEKLIKILCLMSFNSDGCRGINSSPIVTRTIEALGHSKNLELTNNIAVSIGEHLLELISQVPTVSEKAVQGCFSLILSIKTTPLENSEDFFYKLMNFSQLFKYTFAFTSEITTNFFSRGGFDDILDIIKLPFLPLSSTNGFHALISCTKSLPSSLYSVVFYKSLQSLNFLLQRLEDFTGPLANMTDFSQYFSIEKIGDKVRGKFFDLYNCFGESIILLIVSIDSHIEIIRGILANSAIITEHLQEFSSVFNKITNLAKFLLSAGGPDTDENPDFTSFPRPSLAKNKYFILLKATILKFFRTCGKISTQKGNFSINSRICMLNSLGEGLSQMFSPAFVSEDDWESNNFKALCLNFAFDSIFFEESYSTSLIYAFCSSQGMENVIKLLGDLKNISQDYGQNREIDRKLQDSWKKLWILIGKFLEKTVKAKFTNSEKEQDVLVALGCNDSYMFWKELKVEVLFYVRSMDLIGCAGDCEDFIACELEILHYFMEKEEFFVEGKNLGYHYACQRQKNRRGCRNVIEASGCMIKLEEIAEVLIIYICALPSLSLKIAHLLLTLCHHCEVLANQILETLFKYTSMVLQESYQESSYFSNSQKLFGLYSTINSLQIAQQIFFCAYPCDFFELMRKALLFEISQNAEAKSLGLLIRIMHLFLAKGQKSYNELVDIVGNIGIIKNTYKNTAFWVEYLQIIEDLAYKPENISKFIGLKVCPEIFFIENSEEITCPDDLAERVIENMQETPQVVYINYIKIIERILGKRKMPLENFCISCVDEIKRSPTIFCQVLSENSIFKENSLCFIRKPIYESYEKSIIVYEILTELYRRAEKPLKYLISTEALISGLGKILKKYPESIETIYMWYKNHNQDYDFISKVLCSRQQDGFYSFEPYNFSYKASDKVEKWVQSASELCVWLINAEFLSSSTLPTPNSFILTEFMEFFSLSSSLSPETSPETLSQTISLLIHTLKNPNLSSEALKILHKNPFYLKPLIKTLHFSYLPSSSRSYLHFSLLELLELLIKPLSSLENSSKPSEPYKLPKDLIFDSYSEIPIDDFYIESDSDVEENEQISESSQSYEEDESWDEDEDYEPSEAEEKTSVCEEVKKIVEDFQELKRYRNKEIVNKFLEDICEKYQGFVKEETVLYMENLELGGIRGKNLEAEDRVFDKRFEEQVCFLNPTMPSFFNDGQSLGTILTRETEFEAFSAVSQAFFSEPFVGSDILASFLLHLADSPEFSYKIVTNLTDILTQNLNFSLQNPQNTYNYAKVSIKVLQTLQHMVNLHPKISLSISSYQYSDPVFYKLLVLVRSTFYKTHFKHLHCLISLLTSIIEKLGTHLPSLSPDILCNFTKIFTWDFVNDNILKDLTNFTVKICKIPNSKENMIMCLVGELKKTAEEVEEMIRGGLKKSCGVREQQLLRICRVIKDVYGSVEDADFLWKHFSEKLEDIVSEGLPTPPVHILPIIEGFFVFHCDRTNSVLFQEFSVKNHKCINSIIKQKPSLLSSTLNSLIVTFVPSLLDFENKRNYFRSEMRELQSNSINSIIRLHVRRQEVFMDSYHQLKDRSASEMSGKLRIHFLGEEGLDAGGLTREWYGLLARAMFNPNYALFVSSANGVSFQPKSMSSLTTEHMNYFKFVGRIIGKALCDGCPLDLYFTRSFYKHILGQPVNYQDMEDLDADFYKSLKSLMDINLNESELHEYYFAYEEEEFGRHKVKELVPDGRTKRVTEENKMDYIKLLCHMKMTKNIQAQITAFKQGFHEFIPIDLISIFDSKELELLISGLPEVDLEDLKINTDYHNYTENSQVIKWLWEVLYEFSHEERAEFLQFVHGSSKVPLEGFKALPGLGGIQKFQIHKSFTSHDRLPTAHTCMNQLDLPEYPTKEKLKNRLKLAISEGKEGFDFM